MGYLFAVRSGRGVFLYEYEMRYITRRGLRREEEEEEEEKDGRGKARQGKARQGRGIVRYLYLVYFLLSPRFTHFSYSLFG